MFFNPTRGFYSRSPAAWRSVVFFPAEPAWIRRVHWNRSPAGVQRPFWASATLWLKPWPNLDIAFKYVLLNTHIRHWIDDIWGYPGYNLFDYDWFASYLHISLASLLLLLYVYTYGISACISLCIIKMSSLLMFLSLAQTDVYPVDWLRMEERLLAGWVGSIVNLQLDHWTWPNIVVPVETAQVTSAQLQGQTFTGYHTTNQICTWHVMNMAWRSKPGHVSVRFFGYSCPAIWSTTSDRLKNASWG